MITGRAVSFLDGDFKKSYPEPAVFSVRGKQGNWLITKAGPRHCNIYEVTSFDEAGEKWLLENEATSSDAPVLESMSQESLPQGATP